MRRRNPGDEYLRGLERAATMGDYAAAQALMARLARVNVAPYEWAVEDKTEASFVSRFTALWFSGWRRPTLDHEYGSAMARVNGGLFGHDVCLWEYVPLRSCRAFMRAAKPIDPDYGVDAGMISLVGLPEPNIVAWFSMRSGADDRPFAQNPLMPLLVARHFDHRRDTWAHDEGRYRADGPWGGLGCTCGRNTRPDPDPFCHEHGRDPTEAEDEAADERSEAFHRDILLVCDLHYLLGWPVEGGGE